MTLLIATTVRVSVMVLAALLACALLRRRSAATRHWLLAAALACAAMTPALQLIVPAWSFGGGVTIAALPAPSTGRGPAAARTATGFATGSRAGARVPVARQASAVSALGTLSRQRLPQMVLALWLAGLAVALAALGAGLLRLSRVAAAARDTGGHFSPLVEQLSRQLGIGRRVAVLESDHPSLLATWGWRRPKILVPRAARGWSGERLRVVFAHELAHVQRGDWIVQIGADLFRAAFWFNPLVWIACRRLRQESEHACDDAVLGLGVAPPAYATHLLDLARTFSLHRRSWLPAPAIARPSSLERRVSAMLNASTNRNPITRISRLAALAALLAVAVPIAGLAQNGATLYGSARDQTGGLLPGMSVSLELQDSQRPPLTVSTQTDRSGYFEFTGLANGRYVLRAQLPGFTAYTETLTVAVNASVQKELTLHIGELQETITVTGTLGPPPRPVDPRIEQLRRSRASAPVPAPHVVRDATALGGNIKAPRKIFDVRPEYPEAVRAAGIGGVVILQGTIDGNGFVADIHVARSPNDDLARAASDAVYQWEFTPTLLNGSPVDVRMNVVINFEPGK